METAVQEKPKLGRILIVEDDRKTADSLVVGLERGGFTQIVISSGVQTCNAIINRVM
jgi:DNA-binding response OmpR family regulator